MKAQRRLGSCGQAILNMWEKKFAASYTVEAAYIMAMTLLALSILIKSAYIQYQEKTSIMRLHHVAEQLRGQEQEEDRSFWLGNRQIQAGRYGEEVEGSMKGEGKQKEIVIPIHAPENMMRKMAIFQPKGNLGREEGKKERQE